jgi:hypothetical protein
MIYLNSEYLPGSPYNLLLGIEANIGKYLLLGYTGKFFIIDLILTKFYFLLRGYKFYGKKMK